MLRRWAIPVGAVVWSVYALLLGVYAVASTRPEIDSQPQSVAQLRETLAALGIGGPYASELRHGFVQTPHGRMHYAERGTQRPAVLFLHGSGTWSYLYRELLMRSEGHRAVALDLIGFGLSEKLARPEDYSLDGHVDDVHAAVRALGLRELVLVVQGWGAPIGLGLWLREPERIRGLVVLNSFGFERPEQPGALRGAMRRTLAAPLIGEQLVQGLGVVPRLSLRWQLEGPAQRAGPLARAYAGVQGSWSERGSTLAFARMLPRDASREGWVMREAAQWITERGAPPARIVWGMRDGHFGSAALADWRARLPAAPVAELPDAGALVPEDDPEALAEVLSAFLREL